MPPFPQPDSGFNYDAAKGGLINADGALVYQLNEDGTGWTPTVPDDMGAMKLSSTDDGKWALLREDGTVRYTWNPETQTWVEVLQEEEQAAEETTALVVVDCPGAAAPRLVAGEKTSVLRNVNFRSSPGIGEDNWLSTFSAGTELFVIGETVCTEYGSGAYRWWQLEREDGTIGWTAESAAASVNYFLEPVE